MIGIVSAAKGLGREQIAGEVVPLAAKSRLKGCAKSPSVSTAVTPSRPICLGRIVRSRSKRSLMFWLYGIILAGVQK